ncbi:MAG: sugar ABC transporter substrate-binding protein [Gordonia sp. (in: high G+C Gram-positive bacteria)]
MHSSQHRYGCRASRIVVAAATVVSAALVIAGCSSTGGKPDGNSTAGGGVGSAGTRHLTIALITHESPGDTFWDLVRKGAEMAAKKDNVTLNYSSDPQAPNQANLIQTAIDSKVDGIAITLAKPEAMAPAVKKAVEKKIPVVAFNAGFDQWKELGVSQYFGQDELFSGKQAGAHLNTDGAKHVLCVIHEQGSVSLENRCAGVKQGFTNGTVENLNVNVQDMPSVEATLTSKLQQDPSIDYVVTLGAPIAQTAVKSKAAAHSKASIVTFDTNAALVELIKSGQVKWAVDQQPYLQGYLAVDSLWLYLTNGDTIGGGAAVLTGPAFIDESNIAAVADYAKAGTR